MMGYVGHCMKVRGSQDPCQRDGWPGGAGELAGLFLIFPATTTCIEQTLLGQWLQMRWQFPHYLTSLLALLAITKGIQCGRWIYTWLGQGNAGWWVIWAQCLDWATECNVFWLWQVSPPLGEPQFPHQNIGLALISFLLHMWKLSPIDMASRPPYIVTCFFFQNLLFLSTDIR